MLAADDLSLVNCAGCNVELLGERCESIVRQEYGEEAMKNLPGVIAMRMNGRPYCRLCVKNRMVNGKLVAK